MSEPVSPLWRYRANVASRTIVAVAGGYLLAAGSAALVAQMLFKFGMARNDAALSGAMLAFILQAIAFMWAFGCATIQRAWLGVMPAAIVISALAWHLAQGGLST